MNRFLFGLLISILFLFSACKQWNLKREVRNKLQSKIESMEKADTVQGDIYQPDLIYEFYSKLGASMTTRWNSRENVEELISFIRSVGDEGLNPVDYHLPKIDSLTEKITNADVPEADDVVQLELLLTDAYLLLSAHLSEGKVDPEEINAQWHAAQRNANIDWGVYIDSTLENKIVAQSLNNLIPNHREYRNLRKALTKYREIQAEGGWEPFVTAHRKMEKGMVDSAVAQLRKRLSFTQGPILPDTDDENLFDETLHKQVVKFQMRNGLEADGVLGKSSYETLNITIEERIAAIEANLERWRWLSEDLGEKYILTNIANFNLQLVEKNETVFETEVIVGRPYRKTPVFSAVMTHLVLNPDWTIPPTILRNDVIPAVIKNPAYLDQKKMSVITHGGQKVNPQTIDWKSFANKPFPYSIRQEPGPENALGRVKFMFPNSYHVYIHDTPTRNLFRHAERTFSSGCIRMNKPIEFAKLLLEGNDAWPPRQIDKVLSEGVTRTINLKNPLQVHLIYLTAWADDSGTVYFRRDIYERDRPLLTALRSNFEISRL
ncbi:MAG: L,D-transpeptidase family protein [Cyclobacteriaceae bacterium]|nr:L,D-transpeptidase family protein [Cyclobacteriaceae bacterium]